MAACWLHCILLQWMDKCLIDPSEIGRFVVSLLTDQIDWRVMVSLRPSKQSIIRRCRYYEGQSVRKSINPPFIIFSVIIHFLTFVKAVRRFQALVQFFHPNFGRVGLSPAFLFNKPHGVIGVFVCYSSWARNLWGKVQIKRFNDGTLSLENKRR